MLDIVVVFFELSTLSHMRRNTVNIRGMFGASAPPRCRLVKGEEREMQMKFSRVITGVSTQTRF